jgi:hypothetical protein
MIIAHDLSYQPGKRSLLWREGRKLLKTSESLYQKVTSSLKANRKKGFLTGSFWRPKCDAQLKIQEALRHV